GPGGADLRLRRRPPRGGRPLAGPDPGAVTREPAHDRAQRSKEPHAKAQRRQGRQETKSQKSKSQWGEGGNASFPLSFSCLPLAVSVGFWSAGARLAAPYLLLPRFTNPSDAQKFSSACRVPDTKLVESFCDRGPSHASLQGRCARPGAPAGRPRRAGRRR